jgi:hypothetical protein
MFELQGQRRFNRTRPSDAPSPSAKEQFTIGADMNNEERRNEALQRQRDYAQQLENDRNTNANTDGEYVSLRRRRMSRQEKADELMTNPFRRTGEAISNIQVKHDLALTGKIGTEPTGVPSSSSVFGDGGMTFSEYDQGQNSHYQQKRQQQNYPEPEGLAAIGLNTSRSDRNSPNRKIQQAEYGAALREEMQRRADIKQRGNEYDGYYNERVQDRETVYKPRAPSPADPFYSIGNEGIIANLGGNPSSKGVDQDAQSQHLDKRAQQELYAMKIKQDQDQRLRAIAEANVKSRYAEVLAAQPTSIGTPANGIAPLDMDIDTSTVRSVGSEADERRYKQQQYYNQLEMDRQSIPIVRERVSLKKNGDTEKNEMMDSPTRLSAEDLKEHKRREQMRYSDLLRRDGATSSVHERTQDDYARDALVMQHQHRMRYQKQMLNTADMESEVDVSDQAAYNRLVKNSLPIHILEEQAQQYKQHADQLKENLEKDYGKDYVAGNYKGKGLATGPTPMDPVELATRRQQQMAYAKQLAADNHHAKLVMANVNNTRISLNDTRKENPELIKDMRVPSKKVQEYRDMQKAMQQVEDNTINSSLGDLQQGSPYRTHRRKDGEAELPRGLMATGYGANRGPNPRQKPYINEDDLRIRAEQKAKQQEYFRALEESKKLKPIEDSRESWVKQRDGGNGLPNDDGIRTYYQHQSQPFPGTMTGASPIKAPINAVHLGHGYDHEDQTRHPAPQRGGALEF